MNGKWSLTMKRPKSAYTGTTSSIAVTCKYYAYHARKSFVSVYKGLYDISSSYPGRNYSAIQIIEKRWVRSMSIREKWFGNVTRRISAAPYSQALVGLTLDRLFGTQLR